MATLIPSLPETPFSFWSLTWRQMRLDRRKWAHPADREDIKNLFRYHRKYLHTFPAPFFGPLATAKIVVAYAGPGNTVVGKENDNSQGRSLDWVKERLDSFDGKSPLNWKLIQPRARRWFQARLANILGIPKFEGDRSIDSNVAFVNLTAYRGDETKWEEVAFLRSTQVMRNWVRAVLFPEARVRERIVIVMRANRWWGIRNGPWKDGYLFVPRATRSGHIVKNCKVGRAARIAARRAIGVAK